METDAFVTFCGCIFYLFWCSLSGGGLDAITTFYGVRDIFDLFRAVVPLKNQDSLAEGIET